MVLSTRAGASCSSSSRPTSYFPAQNMGGFSMPATFIMWLSLIAAFVLRSKDFTFPGSKKIREPLSLKYSASFRVEGVTLSKKNTSGIMSALGISDIWLSLGLWKRGRYAPHVGQRRRKLCLANCPSDESLSTILGVDSFFSLVTRLTSTPLLERSSIKRSPAMSSPERETHMLRHPRCDNPAITLPQVPPALKMGLGSPLFRMMSRTTKPLPTIVGLSIGTTRLLNIWLTSQPDRMKVTSKMVHLRFVPEINHSHGGGRFMAADRMRNCHSLFERSHKSSDGG